MGRLLALVLFLWVSAGPVQARWLVAETAHFRIYSETSEARLRVQADELEDFHALLVLVTGRETPPQAPKLDIYMVGGRSGLRIIDPDASPDTLGFYRPTDAGIIAVGLRNGVGDSDWMSGREVLLHEYAHHFMFANSALAMPKWYVEGFAEYMATARFWPEKIEYGLANTSRAYSLGNELALPMEALLRGDVRAGARGVFYAQSWMLTHYLFRTPGMTEKLRDYLRRLAQGEDAVTAFQAAVDPDLKGFARKVERYWQDGKIPFVRMTRKPRPPAAVTVTALPPPADDMLLPLVSLQLPQSKETDAANLARLRAAAAKFPGDAWAARVLAVGTAAGGEDAVAAPLLDAQLTLTPDDPWLLRWRAAMFRANRPDASAAAVRLARTLLVRAFKAAPNDWQVLSAYAATFQGLNVPKSVVDVLDTANLLAPQAPGLAFRAGLVLAHAGRHEDAARALGPLVNNPHREAPEWMLRLMAALRTKDDAAVKAAIAAGGERR
ncbi:tetratricopeptide repeat protein [Sandaracinobacteroides saxicola]|uniref:DUF1570 domain-containing protein n=1 Tax=Sandaracinobacteroides saxicola TaxID=2759707 RepID=A0A7G5IKG2_9SPHN|nr:hypothetical protein [Sandaracinobacteroides saxicola]QMW23854.1 hypothetical protein H3309_05105 [Sandaracinobacteroides saxicola]